MGPDDNLTSEPIGGIPTASATLMAQLMHSTHVLGSGILRDTLTLKQQELAKELRNATAGKKLLKWLFEQFNFYFLLQWYIINKILLEQFHYTQGWRFEETDSVIL